MKCHDFRELQIFVEYDHSRESIIMGKRLFDINVYSRHCLKIIRTHLGGGGAIIRGRATIRGNTVLVNHRIISDILYKRMRYIWKVCLQMNFRCGFSLQSHTLATPLIRHISKYTMGKIIRRLLLEYILKNPLIPNFAS